MVVIFISFDLVELHAFKVKNFAYLLLKVRFGILPFIGRQNAYKTSNSCISLESIN
jgi:hypothetical protein